MTKLYLTRHGETEWNKEGRMQGFGDSPLSELGILQGEWLRDRIKDTEIDVIYSSPIGRAYETAKIVRGTRDIEIIKCHGLKELNMGLWEGRTQEDIKAEDKENHFNFWNVPSKYVPTGNGETFYEVKDRSFDTIMDIVKNNKGKRILIVSHTITIKGFWTRLENKSIDELWKEPFIKQTSLTEIDFKEDSFEIKLRADISHHKYSFKEFNE